MNFENKTSSIESHADFDADFSGDIPLLLNIWNRQPGTGEGYEVFKKFLEQVGSGKNFLSTAVTDDGKRLFEKAVNNNLIEMVAPERGIRQFSEWRVL
jgi:hypothetical protein